MFIRIRSSCQVSIGATVIFVGAVGGAVVMLLIGRGDVVLIGAGLDVAAVVFRHLQEIYLFIFFLKKGKMEIKFFSFKNNVSSKKKKSVSVSAAVCQNGRRSANQAAS